MGRLVALGEKRPYMDSMVGKDFEAGLANLMAVAEG